MSRAGEEYRQKQPLVTLLLVLLCGQAALLLPAPARAVDESEDRKLFERLDISGNGYLSGTEVTAEVKKYDANGDGVLVWEEFAAGRAKERGDKKNAPAADDDDEAPAPANRPIKKPAAAAAVKPRPQTTGALPPSLAAPKLPPLEPRPGHVIGRAVFASGRPIPQFRVTALGWAGEVHLGPTGTVPSLGQAVGQNGRYALRTTSAYDRRKPVKALVTSVQADALLSYSGRAYRLAMHPIDGKKDGSGENSFQGDSGKGVVRDFVLRVHGPKRGFEKNPPPRDTETNELSDRSFGAFYGGTIALSLTNRAAADAPEMAVLKGSTVTVTLTPKGSLVDGSAARPVVRTMPIRQESLIGHTYYLRDIPLGDYTATATLNKPDGAFYPLRLRISGGEWEGTAPVVFAPYEMISHVETVHLYLMR